MPRRKGIIQYSLKVMSLHIHLSLDWIKKSLRESQRMGDEIEESEATMAAEREELMQMMEDD